MSIPPEWFQRAVEVVPYGVACVTPDHQFKYLNQKYCEPIGYSSAELVGRTWMSITADEDIGADLKSMDDLQAANSQRDSYSLFKRYRHRDGHLVAVRLTVFAFFEDGAIRYFIACMIPAENTVERVQQIERDIRKEFEELRDEMASIQAGIDFRQKLGELLKKYWVVIAGIASMAATAIWHLARAK